MAQTPKYLLEYKLVLQAMHPLDVIDEVLELHTALADDTKVHTTQEYARYHAALVELETRLGVTRCL